MPTKLKPASPLERLKEKTRELKREIIALELACRDPRTPWYAKAWVACVVAYALSPIDLIPDPIPVLGYLDDLLLLPVGITIALKLVPEEVLDDCRARAAAMHDTLPKHWCAAGVIVFLWLAALAVGSHLVLISF